VNPQVEIFRDDEDGRVTIAIFNPSIVETEGQLVPCAGLTPDLVRDLIAALESTLEGR
jgi:hypothetical protein